VTEPAPKPIDASSVDGVWSWRRLAGVGLGLFVLQIGVIFATGARPSSKTPAAPAGPVVRWLPVAVGPETLATVFAVPDPAGGLLPGEHGFAAESWLRLPALPQVQIDWGNTAHWLALRTNSLGQAHALVPQESRPLLAASESTELPDRLQPPLLPLPTPLRTASEVRLDPGLAERLGGPLPEVPTRTHGDVLADSVVLVWIDDEGRVLSARLTRDRSGLAEADQDAVRIATALPFRPKAGAPLTSGQVRIRWNTLPPVASVAP
jgi:TonB family protein